MQSAAYALLGIRFANGEVHCDLPPGEAPAPRLRSVRYGGRNIPIKTA
jgi:hypothetical protein